VPLRVRAMSAVPCRPEPIGRRLPPVPQRSPQPVRVPATTALSLSLDCLLQREFATPIREGAVEYRWFVVLFLGWCRRRDGSGKPSRLGCLALGLEQ
jgi:hypothetical protein